MWRSNSTAPLGRHAFEFLIFAVLCCLMAMCMAMPPLLDGSARGHFDGPARGLFAGPARGLFAGAPPRGAERPGPN